MTYLVAGGGVLVGLLAFFTRESSASVQSAVHSLAGFWSLLALWVGVGSAWNRFFGDDDGDENQPPVNRSDANDSP